MQIKAPNMKQAALLAAQLAPLGVLTGEIPSAEGARMRERAAQLLAPFIRCEVDQDAVEAAL
jgi:hypothetical protein